VKEKFFNGGGEAVGSSPAQLAEAMKADMERIGRIIKSAGLRAE
jgi:tripartite-type tricarboxylate transporter receptor subunit TctC